MSKKAWYPSIIGEKRDLDEFKARLKALDEGNSDWEVILGDFEYESASENKVVQKMAYSYMCDSFENYFHHLDSTPEDETGISLEDMFEEFAKSDLALLMDDYISDVVQSEVDRTVKLK